jgi:predicted AAA+ superfamily ATPase
LEGPKACGKTQTALRSAMSSVQFDLNKAARDSTDIDPTLILEGPTPRLLDEWQRAPAVWDGVRRVVDERQSPGQFILTGSAVPADESSRHTGAMRILRLVMRPMTLSESGDGSGGVSFASVANGDSVRAADPGQTVRDVARMVARGGWPGNLELSDVRALRKVRGYLNEIARTDLSQAEGFRRDPTSILRLMRSLARNSGTPASLAAITRDVNGSQGSMKSETVAAMIAGLSRLMVVEDLPAWAPSIRSRTRLRASSIHHFVDPSLAVAASGADATRLLANTGWFGFLFEGLVLRDIRVFSQLLGANTYHYRDESGLEADIIVEFADGRWMAIEVKLGHSQIDQAASNLRQLRDRVDLETTGEAVALVVVTATGPAYTRADGVQVIPAPSLVP